jgi:hypothetical protein
MLVRAVEEILDTHTMISASLNTWPQPSSTTEPKPGLRGYGQNRSGPK